MVWRNQAGRKVSITLNQIKSPCKSFESIKLMTQATFLENDLIQLMTPVFLETNSIPSMTQAKNATLNRHMIQLGVLLMLAASLALLRAEREARSVFSVV